MIPIQDMTGAKSLQQDSMVAVELPLSSVSNLDQRHHHSFPGVLCSDRYCRQFFCVAL